MRNWRVYVAVSPIEGWAIVDALRALHPSDQVGLTEWTEPWDALDAPELGLAVAAESADQAKSEARNLLRRARQEAGLPQAPTAMVRYSVVEEVDEVLDDTLWERAHTAMREGRYDHAVVLAQTSCEVLIAWTLRELADARGLPWIAEVVDKRPTNLVEANSRILFNGLSEKEVQDQPWWSDYTVHVRRRNGIVHRGDSVDSASAAESMTAAQSFRSFLRSLTA